MKIRLSCFRTAICVTLALFSGCIGNEPDRAGQTQSQVVQTDLRLRDEHSALTDHLSAAAIWSELLARGAESSDPDVTRLDQHAAYLEGELREALDLASQLEDQPLPEDAQIRSESGRRVVEHLGEAMDHMPGIRASLPASRIDAGALAAAADASRAAIEAAAMAHDSMVVDIPSPDLRYRMFALTWPHHELALGHAGLLDTLDTLAADTGTGWESRWRSALPRLEASLERSRAGLRGFADQIQILPGVVGKSSSYGRERRDDTFNEATDTIRQSHETASDNLEALGRELLPPRPDQTRTLERVTAIRTAILNAQAAHQRAADEFGQPCPDYALAFGRSASVSSESRPDPQDDGLWAPKA